MDHTFYKFTMTKQIKVEEAKAIMSMILHLKTQPSTVETKKTIQTLQQQLMEFNKHTDETNL